MLVAQSMTKQLAKLGFALKVDSVLTVNSVRDKFDFVEMIVLSVSQWSWLSLGFYVSVHARTFGSQPDCNAATKLIVFGRELSATGSG